MNIFGIGTQEMVIVLVAALVIFGPGKLPEVAGQLGRAVRDFRRMTSDLSGEFEKTFAEVNDVKKAMTSEITGVRSQVSNVTQSVKKDLASPKTAKEASAKGSASTIEPVGKAMSRTTRTPTSAKTATAPIVAAKASKKDPLAGISMMEFEPSTAAQVNGSAMSTQRPNRGVQQTTPTSASPMTTGGDGLAEPETRDDDPLARARQRRVTAGYNRPRL